MSTAYCVSVVIPTYNRREFIGETIDSVLVQTYRKIEVIVVDDGSTDGTAEYLKTRYHGESRFRYIWQKNSERSIARNTGILQSRGDYVAFLDSDDLWLPRKLEAQMGLMSANPDLVMTVTWFSLINDKGDTLQTCNFPNVDEVASDRFAVFMVAQNRIGSPTPLIKRKALFDAGLFCPALSLGEDWDLWTRVSCSGKVAVIPEVHALHRVHQGNSERDLTPGDYINVVSKMKKTLQKPFWIRLNDEAARSYWRRLQDFPPRTWFSRGYALINGLLVFGGFFYSNIFFSSWRQIFGYVMHQKAAD